MRRKRQGGERGPLESDQNPEEEGRGTTIRLERDLRDVSSHKISLQQRHIAYTREMTTLGSADAKP